LRVQVGLATACDLVVKRKCEMSPEAALAHYEWWGGVGRRQRSMAVQWVL
jgi:hypothetical protein